MNGFGATKFCVLLIFLALMAQQCFADLDVNAIAGRVTIDAMPAPSGTPILVHLPSRGLAFTTFVDGPNVPPFMYGQGMYDTGDVPELETGDLVKITLSSQPELGRFSIRIRGGTTLLDLDFCNVSSGSAQPIEDEMDREGNGTEDIIIAEVPPNGSDGIGLVEGNTASMVTGSVQYTGSIPDHLFRAVGAIVRPSLHWLGRAAHPILASTGYAVAQAIVKPFLHLILISVGAIPIIMRREGPHRPRTTKGQ